MPLGMTTSRVVLPRGAAHALLAVQVVALAAASSTSASDKPRVDTAAPRQDPAADGGQIHVVRGDHARHGAEPGGQPAEQQRGAVVVGHQHDVGALAAQSSRTSRAAD